MHEPFKKAHLVKAKLKSLDSEIEFWKWYKAEIEEGCQFVDDLLSFGEAIKIE